MLKRRIMPTALLAAPILVVALSALAVRVTSAPEPACAPYTRTNCELRAQAAPAAHGHDPAVFASHDSVIQPWADYAWHDAVVNDQVG